MSRQVPARSELRTDLGLLLLVAAGLFLVSLGARDLWHPNEPTYGQAVAEMAARGDWVVPTVGGRTFGEKPILYYWMALVASRVTGGVGELALRLPQALSGIAAVLLVYGLVWPYAGRRRARIAALLFATTFMVWWGARSVQMDFLVAVSTLGAIAAVVRVWDHDGEPWRGWALAGLAAGLGFAAKGPVALVLPAATLGLYAVVTGRPRRLLERHVLLALAVGAAAAAPWLVLLLVRGETELLREVLWRQNVERFVDAWDHREPWWYYLKYFWIDMAPWAWLVPLAAALPGRTDDERRLDRLAWVWIAAVLLLFSASESKRSAYILPLAPAVAVLAAALADRLIAGSLPAWRRRAALAVPVVAAVLLAVAGWSSLGRLIERYPDAATPLRALVLLATGGALACTGSLFPPFRARVAVPAAFFSLVLSLYVLGASVLLPAADRYKSARSFGARVVSVVPADAPLASFGSWTWRADHLFYTGRSIPDLATRQELERYWASRERVFLIVRNRKLAPAREVIGDVEPLIVTPIGSRVAYLFSNRPDQDGT